MKHIESSLQPFLIIRGKGKVVLQRKCTIFYQSKLDLVLARWLVFIVIKNHQEELLWIKIIEWVEKEGNKKVVSFSNSSSSNNGSSSGSVSGIGGGNVVK